MQLSVCQTLIEGLSVWAERSGVLPGEEQSRHSDRGKGGVCEGCL